MITLDKPKLKEVTSIKLFKDQNKLLKYIDQDGLLSERIFGPTKSYKCSNDCLKLNSKTQEGQTCKSCGVKSMNNTIRYKYFGKINLPFHIIRSTKKRNLRTLIKKEFNHILDPKRNDFSSTVKSFLQYDRSDPGKLEMVNTFNPVNCIPLNITGIFSLYLALRVMTDHFGNIKTNEYLSYFYDELLVIPPNCRLSIVGNDGGKRKIIVHDLDNTYNKILHIKKAILANSDPKAQVQEFIDMITNSIEAKMLDYIDDPEIQNFDEDLTRLQFRCDSIYSYIEGQLSGKEGLIRKDFLGRHIDFSARTVIIPDPTLDAYQVKIPKRIFIRLWLIEYSRWLWKVKEIAFEKIRLFVKSTDIHDGYLEHVDEFIEYFFEHASQREKLVFLNRQPTLWRYGNSVVEVTGVTEENAIKISPLIVKPLAADFDGDALAIYRIHSQKATNEMYDNAFLLNTLKYDHNDQFLHFLMNEAKYCYSILIESKFDNPFNSTKINSTSELEIDYNKKLTDCIIINENHITSYGVCLVNKFAGFDTIYIDSNDGPEEVSQKIYLDSNSNQEYHKRLNNLNNLLNWFLTVYSSEVLTLPFVEASKEIQEGNQLINNLPDNPYIGNTIFNALIDRSYAKMDPNQKLSKLQKGKFNKKQFARSIVGIGYISDDRNIIQDSPIVGTLLQGLTEDQFFETSFGTRKGKHLLF